MPNLSAKDPMKSEVKAESPVYKMRSTSPILRYWLKLINACNNVATKLKRLATLCTSTS